jgi:hypothetical protein
MPQHPVGSDDPVRHKYCFTEEVKIYLFAEEEL